MAAQTELPANLARNVPFFLSLSSEITRFNRARYTYRLVSFMGLIAGINPNHSLGHALLRLLAASLCRLKFKYRSLVPARIRSLLLMGRRGGKKINLIISFGRLGSG